MKEPIVMPFAALLELLETLNPAAPLIFVADGREIGPGYHVTELRHSLSTGIDCGGNVDTWDEARLQLLDGPGQTHMSVAKFRGIIGKGLDRLPVLAQTPFIVEFGPDNTGLRLMTVGSPHVHDDRVLLPLRHSRAVCKPALRGPETHSCCGSAVLPDLAARCCA